MLVTHSSLFRVTPDWSWEDCFQYSNQAEIAVAALLGVSNPVVTEGYAPGYDFSSKGLKYEVKFQNTHRVNLEFKQEKSGSPSGVLTSTADWWIVVSTGITMQGEVVGKVRGYRTSTLQEIVQGYLNESPPSHIRYFTLTPRDIPHTWLGDVTWDPTTATWDVSQWTKRGSPLPPTAHK